MMDADWQRPPLSTCLALPPSWSQAATLSCRDLGIVVVSGGGRLPGESTLRINVHGIRNPSVVLSGKLP